MLKSYSFDRVVLPPLPFVLFGGDQSAFPIILFLLTKLFSSLSFFSFFWGDQSAFSIILFLMTEWLSLFFFFPCFGGDQSACSNYYIISIVGHDEGLPGAREGQITQ